MNILLFMTDSSNLTKLKCVSCEGWMKPMTGKETEPLLKQLPDWELVDDIKIEKKFKFKDFKSALDFVNKVGELAEKEQHHPNIYLYGWNKVKITLTTHILHGLSQNDFIMAVKINKIQV